VIHPSKKAYTNAMHDAAHFDALLKKLSEANNCSNETCFLKVCPIHE
jgi:hypothetical protein